MSEVKLNFVLIGKAGCGRSSTGNTILSRKVFNTSCNSVSATKTVDYSSCHFGQYLLHVVDAPSVIDPDIDRDESETASISNMDTAVRTCFGGVDAFLLVLQFPCKFTSEDMLTLVTLKKIFGDRLMNHVIVVLTYGDLFEDAMKDEDREESFDEWCMTQVGQFRQLYDDCEGRFVLFSNREKDEAKKQGQILKLVQLAQMVQADHGRYTADYFNVVEMKCTTTIQHQTLSQENKHEDDRAPPSLPAEHHYPHTQTSFNIDNQMTPTVPDRRGQVLDQETTRLSGAVIPQQKVPDLITETRNSAHPVDAPQLLPQLRCDNQISETRASPIIPLLREHNQAAGGFQMNNVLENERTMNNSTTVFLHQSANLNEPELTAEIFEKLRLLVEFNESLPKRPSDSDTEIVQSIVWELKRAIQEHGTDSELMKDILAEVKIIEDQHAVVLDKTSTTMHRSNIESSQLHMDDEEVRLNVLLIGKTGHGKSATGNMILNRRVFKTSTNTISQTKEVNSSFAQLGCYILLVVDGPGLEDTDLTKVQNTEVARKNMDIALSMCYGGVDAFLFVLKFGAKLTKEERSVLSDLKRIFGDTFMSHVIIIVTAGDLFSTAMKEEGRNISFNDWCMEQKGEFYQLCAECQGCVVLCDNRMSDNSNTETRQAQREQIVKVALDLKTRNGRYTSESFQKADIERKKLEKNVPQLTREIQEKICLLAADIDALPDKLSEADKKKIKERIQIIKIEIELQDGGSGVLKDSMEIVKSIEINLDDVVKIRELARELDATRTSKEIWNRVGNVLTVAGCILTFIFPPVGLGVVIGSRIGTVTANVAHTLYEKDLQVKIQDKRLNLKK